jgi:hypothetical protein
MSLDSLTVSLLLNPNISAPKKASGCKPKRGESTQPEVSFREVVNKNILT